MRIISWREAKSSPDKREYVAFRSVSSLRLSRTLSCSDLSSGRTGVNTSGMDTKEHTTADCTKKTSAIRNLSYLCYLINSYSKSIVPFVTAVAPKAEIGIIASQSRNRKSLRPKAEIGNHCVPKPK